MAGNRATCWRRKWQSRQKDEGLEACAAVHRRRHVAVDPHQRGAQEAGDSSGRLGNAGGHEDEDGRPGDDGAAGLERTRTHER